MTGRLAIAVIGIALANVGALGLLIGMVGASRAFSVGLHTLFQDHLPAVAITLAATALLAIALGRSLHARRQLMQVMAFAAAADFATALAVTLVFDEMRNALEIALPRAIFTETVGGLQLLTIAAGAALGFAIGPGRRGASSSEIQHR